MCGVAGLVEGDSPLTPPVQEVQSTQQSIKPVQSSLGAPLVLELAAGVQDTELTEEGGEEPGPAGVKERGAEAAAVRG